MSFPSFETYKKQSPTLAKALDKLEDYLEQALTRPLDGQDVHPMAVSGALNIPVGQVMGLLQIAQEAGVLIPRIDVYCPETGDFIESFTWPEKPPKVIECQDHPFDDSHPLENCKLEVVYQFTANTREHQAVTA